MATQWYMKATLVGDSHTQPSETRPGRERAAAMSTRAMPAASGTPQALAAGVTPAVAGTSGLPDPAILQSVGVRGYDTFTGRQCGHPLVPAPLVSVPASATGQEINYEICSVTSASELRQKISVSAEASFSGFGVDAGAKAEWSREQATNELSLYLLVKITVRNATLTLGNFQLNADAKSLVGSLKEFYRRYGDCFISDYVTGGEFLGLYQFHTRSTSERKQVSAKVRGAGGMWSGSGKFGEAMDGLDVDTDVTLSVFINGGLGALPDFKPEAVVKFAQQFPLAVDPIKGSAALYDFKTTSYYKAIDFPNSLDLPFTANHLVLEALAEEMDRVRAYRFAVDDILRNPQRFGDKTIDGKQIHAQLKEIEKKINVSAGTVADNAWQVEDLRGLAVRVQAELDAVAAKLPEEKEIHVTHPGRSYYVIRSVSTARVFDIPGHQKERGARLHMWDRHNDKNQLWSFEKQADGSYVIRSVLNNNLVLDVTMKPTHTPWLITGDDNGERKQRWRLDAQQDGSVIIRSVLNDLVLDIEKGGTENGSKLQLLTQHGGWNQRFFLEEVVHLPG